MGGTINAKYRLVAKVVQSREKPKFEKVKPRKIFTVSKTELDWARKLLTKGSLGFPVGTATPIGELAKQAAKKLRKDDPFTEINSFLVNTSIPVGPIWKKTPLADSTEYLHPMAKDRGICVACTGAGAGTRWWQLAFEAREVT